jgi:hypothetical protein
MYLVSKQLDVSVEISIEFKPKSLLVMRKLDTVSSIQGKMHWAVDNVGSLTQLFPLSSSLYVLQHTEFVNWTCSRLLLTNLNGLRNDTHVGDSHSPDLEAPAHLQYGN